MAVFGTDIQARPEITLTPRKRSFWASRSGKALCFAAGSFALAGLGAFFYATRVETKLFRLDTVDITTGAGPDPKASAKGQPANESAGGPETNESAKEADANESAKGSDTSASAKGAKPSRSGKGADARSPMLPLAPERELRILHISDTHLCGDDYAKAEFLREATEEEYDIIVLTGDIFETYSGIKFASSLLARKPRIGAFAVLGNHDYYQYSMFNKTVGRIVRKWRHGFTRDVTPIVRALREVGFSVLQNESTSVPEHKLFVVGIDWPSIEEEHLQRLMKKAPEGHFELCLFHLPKNLDYISNAGFDLAVGGHTHGGQIRIPGFGPIITDSELPRHEACGLVRRGGTVFHISRGLGADPRTNIRFFCPPAITALNVTHYGRR